MEKIENIFKAAGLSLKSGAKIPTDFEMPTIEKIASYYRNENNFKDFNKRERFKFIKQYMLNNYYFVIEDWDTFLKNNILSEDFKKITDNKMFDSTFFKIKYKGKKNILQIVSRKLSESEICKLIKIEKTLSKNVQLELLFCNDSQKMLKIKGIISADIRKAINETNVITQFTEVLPKIVFKHTLVETIKSKKNTGEL